MANVNLKKSSGLDINVQSIQLIQNGISFTQCKTYELDDLRAQLLNSEINSPELLYVKYSAIDFEDVISEKNIRLSMYTIPSNLAGIEYVKTTANVSFDYNRVVEIWHGGGSLILQEFESDKAPLIVKVKKGQKIIVPAGYVMSISNTRASLMIVGEVISSDAKINRVLDEMHGMPYYFIKKNAKQEIVRNPLYRSIDGYEKFDIQKVATSHGVTLKTPIIKQILRKYDKFGWLFKKNEPITI